MAQFDAVAFLALPISWPASVLRHSTCQGAKKQSKEIVKLADGLADVAGEWFRTTIAAVLSPVLPS
jgi:hypothetical protein